MIKWFEKNVLVSWIIVVLIAIFIFYISSRTFINGSPGPNWSIKPYLYHFGIYLLLALFFLISISQGKFNRKKLFIFGIFLLIFYALLDEIHQLYVPNRSCSFVDFMTDSVGIMISSTFYSLRLYLKKNIKQRRRLF